MPDRQDAVRSYLVAASTADDDAITAARALLADGVTFTSPLGAGTGPDAVIESLKGVQPMLAAATWSDPVVDGDVVTVTAELPPGSILGTAGFTFHFDANGRIAQLSQRLSPGAPPPATAVALEGAIAHAVDGALDNGTPIIAAYVDGNGQPQLSLRGTVQVYSSDQVALWIRDPNGGLVRALPGSPKLSFFYRDPATRAVLQIQGRACVDDDPHVRDVVFDNSPPREQTLDPDRLGLAVVVDVDRVQGRLPDGVVNMGRGA